MGGIFFALVVDGWVPEALLIVGVGLAILATVLYARTGMREVARGESSRAASVSITFNLRLNLWDSDL